MTGAVLLDIDGTLVDSNYLHVQAWMAAMDQVNHPVSAWRVHRAIGMDASGLLARLLGPKADELGERAKEAHSRVYAGLAGDLRPLRGAGALLAALHQRGLSVVLATSAPEQELERLLRVLDCDEAITAVTSSGDVSQAKPHPAIVQVALDRAGVEPAHAVFVGDTGWDVQAAGRAGVRCIGLLSGGIGHGELIEAGAVGVYDDATDLLEHLAHSPVGSLRTRASDTAAD